MHLVTRSTPYVTIVVLVGYRTVLVVFRISSIEVLKQRLRATVATRGGRVSATVVRATATSLMTKRSTCGWCGLFNHLHIQFLVGCPIITSLIALFFKDF